MGKGLARSQSLNLVILHFNSIIISNLLETCRLYCVSQVLFCVETHPIKHCLGHGD